MPDEDGNALQGLIVATPICLALWALVAWLVWGCAINTAHRPDHLPQSIRLGLYVEQGLPLERVAYVFDEIRAAMACEGVEVYLAWAIPVERCGDSVMDMLRSIMAMPDHQADKVLLLACASAGHVLLTSMLPTPQGATELIERHRAVAIAEVTGIETMIMGPGGVAVHDVYHLMGWDH